MYIPTPLFDSIEYLHPTPALERYSSLALTHEQIAPHAATEFDHACTFLYSYRGSPATFNAYRRELERLFQWAWFQHNKPIIALNRLDIEAFIEFCQQPIASWIGTQHTVRFIEKQGQRHANPEWRPFVATVTKQAYKQGRTPNPKHYNLSQKAVQAIFAVLSSFFNYLIQEDYLPKNPVAQIRQKSKFVRKQQQSAPIRRLSELQWRYVIETAEIMAQSDPSSHERTLFIMQSLYGMYLRISELAASKRWIPKMGDFHRDLEGSWWFTTVGKGNKERLISVSDAMLIALKRFRISLGLTALPAPGETLPLLPKLKGRGPMVGTRHIRRIVQTCFDAAILRLQQDGLHDEANALQAATVHWLRHTGISEDVKIRPREHVRDDAGHGSSAITDRYIDIELRARHASAKYKRIKPTHEKT
ncbi:MAG: site-specific integrase [Gammaproteobacteria bacterium]